MGQRRKRIAVVDCLKHLNKGNQISMFDEPALEGIVDQDELEDEAFLNGQ